VLSTTYWGLFYKEAKRAQERALKLLLARP
jgi:hypothetical protein